MPDSEFLSPALCKFNANNRSSIASSLNVSGQSVP